VKEPVNFPGYQPVELMKLSNRSTA